MDPFEDRIRQTSSVEELTEDELDELMMRVLEAEGRLDTSDAIPIEDCPEFNE